MKLDVSSDVATEYPSYIIAYIKMQNQPRLAHAQSL